MGVGSWYFLSRSGLGIDGPLVGWAGLGKGLGGDGEGRSDEMGAVVRGLVVG